MSGHIPHHFSMPSDGYGYDSGLIQDIVHDICDLLADLFKLLETHGCHPPCYCPGTMIATVSGEKAVEDLEVGDLVMTASGHSRPIRWIGHRRLDIQRHADPASVRPVRVTAGAFGEALPRRDLVVSPGHSIFVEDVLIPVRFLINGATILQDHASKTVTYYHVELESHDILLAEGLAAESYLDTGNRSDFENDGRLVEPHPRFESKDWADTCAPLVKSGPTVEEAKRGLIDRAGQLGHSITHDHDLHVVADGATIKPLWDGRVYHFAIPEGSLNVRLASRCWVPAHLSPDSQDDRELGVCVARLEIDQKTVDLGTLSSGWHKFDVSGGTSYRWTTGSADLPSYVRNVAVQLCGTARYWAEDGSLVSAPVLRQAA